MYAQHFNILNPFHANKTLHFDHPFYNSIIIIDNRFDSTLIPDLDREKNLLVPPVVLHGSTSAAIMQYVENRTKQIPGKDSTLLIELRRYELNFNGVYFFANAYYKSGNTGFIMLASIDTIFRTQWEHFISGKAIDVFLAIVDKSESSGYSDSVQKFSIQSIQKNNVKNDWLKYPVNNTETYTNGIFESPQMFRMNQPEKRGISMRMGEDSVYILSLTDSLPDGVRRNNSWLNSNHSQGIIGYREKLYYMIQYPLCLPLEKKGGTFYFHMPPSLPNMYYFNLAREMGLNTGLSPGLNTVSAGSLAFSSGVSILGFFVRKEQVKSIIKKGTNDPTMRDCYIDLDTGIVKYN